MALYEVFADYSAGSVCEVVFFDASAAESFVRQQNDTVQAEHYRVEEVQLIDNYGFPFDRRNLSVVWPHHFDIPGWVAA